MRSREGKRYDTYRKEDYMYIICVFLRGVIIPCLCFLYPVNIYGQDVDRLININQKKGLPTDYIYDMIVDRNGYLWLATQKGVVKYNGYEIKVFNFSSGLPNEDVWSLYEDKKGRVWCGSHANRIGYIQNDSFHLTENIGFNETLYPREIRDYNDGVAFVGRGTLFYEKNDTFRKKVVSNTAGFSFLKDNNELLLCDEKLYYKIANADTKPDTVFSFPKTERPINKDVPWNLFTPWKVPGTYGDDFLVFRMEGDTLWKISQGHITPVVFDVVKKNKSRFISFFKKNGYLYLRFNNLILQVNAHYKVIHSFFLPGTNNAGANIPLVIQHPLWGTVMATNTQGLFIKGPMTDNFVKQELLLKDCVLLGHISDTSVWWRQGKHSLFFISRNKIVKSVSLPDVFLKTFVQYKNNQLLLLFPHDISYWLNLSTGKRSRPYYPFLPVVQTVSAATNLKKDMLIIACSPNVACYTLSDKGANNMQTIDSDKYKEILYDASYDCFLFYKYDKLVIYRHGIKTILNKEHLGKFGIRNIDDIVIDAAGNWFIKDNKCVYWVNIGRRFFKKLNVYVNLSDSKMTFNGHDLIIAGRFGTCFYRVGEDMTYKYYMIVNPIDRFFDHVYTLCNNDGGFLLNTDNGTFSHVLPNDSLFTSAARDYIKYTLLVKYNTAVFNCSIRDTIKLSQINRRLFLDVVNHFGNGKLHFAYALNGTGNLTDLSNNELFLENFDAGQYNRVDIIASDNAWVSGRKSFVVYIIPLWWQTSYGQVAIVIIAFIFIGLIVLVVFLATRMNIKKRTERNQLQMDIELKSIYSQINPHFIFNTLSGTQYFIRENKNQEARLHLNKFSRLLRSYIHSSRNKYITIKDELSNLVNYIELQQIRFADKFDYKINVAEDLPIDLVKIPSLLLQPIVENAINHGLFHVEGYRGLLKLDFYKDAQTDEIVCITDDNGVGRPKAREIKADSIVKTQSYGDALIKDFISIFNKYEKLNIEIQYIDKAVPETGTTVIIKIKNPVYESRTN